MGLKRFLRSPADHDLSTLFVLCQKTEWVGGWWWGAFNYHGFTFFELLKLCSCQNDNGWLLMSLWKLFWSWQKNNYLIWSDGQQICKSFLVTICTHMYLQYVPIYIYRYIYLQYVPIFMYNMYSYLYTIFSHIYIQYVPTYIYLQYVPISIYTSRNMYHHIKVLVSIST